MINDYFISLVLVNFELSPNHLVKDFNLHYEIVKINLLIKNLSFK